MKRTLPVKQLKLKITKESWINLKDERNIHKAIHHYPYFLFFYILKYALKTTQGNRGLITCAYSKDSGQSVHPRCLIRGFAISYED